MSDDLPDELTDELTDEGFSGDPAEDDIEGGELEEAALEDGGAEEPFEDEEAGADEDEDEDEDEVGARPADAAGDEEEDEPDPDEVEADLDAILKDRIAASDDDEEEEEEGAPPKAPSPAGLVERQETEIHCPHCFLLVQAKTVAEMGECGHCGGPIS